MVCPDYTVAALTSVISPKAWNVEGGDFTKWKEHGTEELGDINIS